MTELNGVERSTATDRLRAMLTERGVKWNSTTSPLGSIWINE